MAEILTMDVAYSRKIQLEQFEPVQSDVEIRVVVGEGEDPDEVYDEYIDKAEDMVERHLAGRIAQKKMMGEEDEDE